MRPLLHSALIVLVQGTSLVVASELHAQSAPDSTQLSEARAHYERALALFDEGRLPASLAEFEAAYAASHRPAILYNLGSVHALMGHSVEAVDALRRYLSEGAGSIDLARQEAVQSEIAIQEARIARVQLSVNVPGAEITLDDVPIGTAPLADAVRVSAGEHVVSSRADGFDPMRFRFSVAGLEQRTIALELNARASDAGVLELTTNVPGANVELDGRSLGLTPIEFPVGVSVGSHTLRITRPGYREHERIVPVAASANVVLEVELTPLEAIPEGVATRLDLTLPATSHTVRIDGQRVLGDAIVLPYGLHDIAIEAADIEPVTRRLVIPQQPSFAFDPGYRWTESGRQQRLAGADSQRVNGGAIVLGGGSALLIGVGLIIGREVMAGESNLSGRRDAFDSSGACRNFVSMPEPCEQFLLNNTQGFERDPETFRDRTNELLGIYESLLIAGAVVAGAGAVTVIGGLVFILTAPSEEDIDRGTTLRVSLDVSPNGLLLHGQF